VLLLVFFKLLWRQRFPVTLQPFWILRKERMDGKELNEQQVVKGKNNT
jgi:hypothetical protein